MALTAVGEPTPTASATIGGEPGGSAPESTGDTPTSSVEENGEGQANAPGDSLPRIAAQGPGDDDTGPPSDDAERAAATSPTNDEAGATNASAGPANKDASVVAGDGHGGEEEHKNTVGVDQPNLDVEGSSAKTGEYLGDGGKAVVATGGPAWTGQHDGQPKQSEEAPVRIASRLNFG